MSNTPFVKEMHAYLKLKGLSLADIDSDYLKPALELAKARILCSCKRGSRYPDNLDNVTDLDLSLLSYPLAIAILAYIGNPILTRRFAVYEARRAGRFLRWEPEEKVVSIARGTFGWDIRRVRLTIGKRTYTLAIHFTDYLSVSFPREPHWKLVNRIMLEGYVLLQKHELARLIEERVRRNIMDKIENAKLDAVPKALEEASLEILCAVRSSGLTETFPSEKMSSYSPQGYPPCIAKLVEDATAGKNLSHTARFALATFLLNVGMSVDEVVDLFRRMPDFREEITRYQVEHLAGLRGSKIKYSPPSCENMRSAGLCPEELKDALCNRVRHPLMYYYLKIKRGITYGKEKKPHKEDIS